ncbi:MAG: hypothetical protein JWN44_2546 [Myxococcales bacterium]|nr:hypothetical protein [Myxococcales bacterium]
MPSMIALLITLFLSPATSDSTALVAEQAKLTVRYDKGAVTIVRVERQPMKSPARMPRWRGRFEARAVAAGKTLDFVRFDFPLMAAAEAPDDVTEDAAALGRKLREHVTATTIVKAPLPPGATQVVIYDSATKKTVSVDLPGSPTPAATGGDGSSRK